MSVCVRVSTLVEMSTAFSSAKSGRVFRYATLSRKKQIHTSIAIANSKIREKVSRNERIIDFL